MVLGIAFAGNWFVNEFLWELFYVLGFVVIGFGLLVKFGVSVVWVFCFYFMFMFRTFIAYFSLLILFWFVGLVLGAFLGCVVCGY